MVKGVDRLSRRQLLKRSAGLAAGVLVAGGPASARQQSANDKLNIGVIGVGNRGGANLAGVSTENIAALCDVDETILGAAAARFPSAKTYTDFRKLLEQRDLDAVVVSTPDHTHAVAGVMALKAGLHLYCEKPLAHSVYEVRTMTDEARKRQRVTQMGTQIHAEPNYRRVVELVQAGTIGPISEVHFWCSANPSGGERPRETPPVPAGLHYDLWLGPAPYRPYHPAYLPGAWRGWWDFGGGGLADFGCHYMDLPFWALDLRYPTTVYAQGPERHPESTPSWLTVEYRFPARGQKPPVALTWYNGPRQPELLPVEYRAAWASGVLFVGTQGRMLLADYGRRLLLPEADFQGFQPPAPTIPDSIGHHAEWIRACKTGEPTTCNFGYSGPLAEAVALGNAAYRTGHRLEWDAARLRVTNCQEAQQFIRPPFRSGWSL